MQRQDLPGLASAVVDDQGVPITTCLPGSAARSIFEEPPRHKITLRHLLNPSAYSPDLPGCVATG